ncbi:MAG TPA: hypothetical protein DDX06_13675 [Curvibacter sp.]|nr:hypothetical protein [Curvibacter sp.]
MTRLTDHDTSFGPLTFGRSSWRPWCLVFSTGGGCEGHPHNSLTAYAFGWVARLNLPTRMKPWRRWVDTSHYNWKGSSGGYWDEYPREYGFSLSDGFLQVFLGAQTHDSVTTQSWCTHLPWTQWRHIRHSLFDEKGDHFWTEWSRPSGFKLRDNWTVRYAVKKECPAVVFEFDDYDGKRIKATTRIEEREWHFGEGWFKWLSLFRSRKIRRSLDIEFSEEVGPEKGSWKGGTTGTGIDLLPGELHEDAFRRYCDQEHRAKYRKYTIQYIGRVEQSA